MSSMSCAIDRSRDAPSHDRTLRPEQSALDWQAGDGVSPLTEGLLDLSDAAGIHLLEIR